MKLYADSITQEIDLVQSDNQIATEDGLETAVLISLYTDRRADDSDEIDDNLRRGSWLDAYADVEGYKIGSKLWILRQKRYSSAKTLNLAEEYSLDALQWLIEDGIASDVRVTASWLRDQVLKLAVDITKPSSVIPQWQSVWEGTYDV